MKKFLSLLVLVIWLPACLVTRQEVRQSVKNEPLSADQVKKSNLEVQYQETEEEMRKLNGRIEVLENSMNVLNADKSGSHMEQQNDKKTLNEKLKIYEETLSKLESQYLLLSQKVEALQIAATSKTAAKGSDAAKSPFEEAEEDFSKKRWKEAIIAYEKYRSQNPKGKKYAEATFKIGSSFLELGMKAEAKAFYSEVTEKFAKSDWAKKAEQRLKILK